MSRNYVVIAVVLPLLAIGFGIARAELTFARSRDFNFEIAGYDPRDLLRGHYLQFRLRLDPITSRCSKADANCCICLEQSAPDALVQLERADCGDVRSCDGWLAPEAAGRALRYYIPDTRAAELERRLIEAVSRRGARARIAVDPKGQPHVRELFIDGEPIQGSAEPAGK